MYTNLFQIQAAVLGSLFCLSEALHMIRLKASSSLHKDDFLSSFSVKRELLEQRLIPCKVLAVRKTK